MLKQELHNLSFDISTLLDHNISAIQPLRNKVVSKQPYYKVLSPEIITDSFGEVRQIAEQISENFTDVIVISMGGANLNPASLITALPDANKVKVHFLSSTNPAYINSKIEGLNLKNTAILTISKSGNTLETIAILAAILNIFDQQGISRAGRYYFVTKQEDCKLNRIAKEIEGIIIEHDQQISGRYSGLSVVTLLPALIAGVNVEDYVQGATLELEHFLKRDDASPIKAALAMYHLQKNIHIDVIYNNKLQQFSDWKSQIIAESLGKQGLGYTPVASIGPEDQHSMYQLYLDGPDDKFYSYFSVNDKNDSSNIVDYSVDSSLSGLDHIRGMKLSEIHQINEDASFEALRKKGRALRRITLDGITAKSMGSLIASSMIEIILLGEILAINPFNQDGVELIKQEARSMVGDCIKNSV